MSKPKKKYTKIGAVLKGQYGPFVVLGNDKAKDDKYNYDVQIMVKNAAGDKLALVKNPMLTLKDPREFLDKDGNPRQVNDKVMYELSIVEDMPENE
jgi:predicted MPP superfamily phosphohydrolase